VLGAIVALGCTPLLPPGIPVMLAALAALAGAVRHDRRPPDDSRAGDATRRPVEERA
jgi:hypothetical protein